jgi:membrane protein
VTTAATGSRADAHPVASAQGFLAQLWREMDEDNVWNGAAALGFYLTLAVFPTMIFLMALVPYLPVAHVDQAIMDLLHQVLPARTAEMFAGVVSEVASERRGGVLTFGIAAALWASSTGMYAVMQQMNIAYDVDERRGFIRARATALGLSLLFVVLVIGAFSLVVLGGVIQDWIGRRLGVSDTLLNFFIVFRWVVIVLALLVAIALIYDRAPSRRRRFALLTRGTIIATASLLIASLAFRVYVTNFGNYSATYGSIGAVIVLMLWFYLAGLVMLVGAEIDSLAEARSQSGSAIARKDALTGD